MTHSCRPRSRRRRLLLAELRILVNNPDPTQEAPCPGQ